jgi:iron complex outermembrane receptor protein
MEKIGNWYGVRRRIGRRTRLLAVLAAASFAAGGARSAIAQTVPQAVLPAITVEGRPATKQKQRTSKRSQMRAASIARQAQTGADRAPQGPIDGWPGGLPRDYIRSTTDLNAPNTIGSRLPGTARDIPASVESINQATMQERGKTSWVDALQGLTGFTSAVRPGAAGVASTRGFTENGIAVLYDGIRVTNTTISTRNYDSFIFDRVDVLRGPASVLYGEGAIGGAVNLVRKQPSGVNEPFETISSLSTREGVRQAVGKGGPLGNGFSYRLDGVVNGYNGPVDDNQVRYGNVAGALRWDVTPQLSSTVDFDYMKSKIENAYWGTPLVRGQIRSDLREVNYNNLPNNKYDDSVLWLRWNTTYDTEELKIRNRFWSYQSDRDWINTYRFAYIPAGGTCSFRGQNLLNNTGTDQVCRQTWENLGYDHRFIGDRFDVNWNGSLGAMPLSTVMGVEVASTRWDSPRNEVTSLQLVDPYNPAPTDFFTRGTARTQNVRADLTQKAVFGEARLEVLKGVKIVGGFRVDQMEVDYNRQPTNQLYSKTFEPSTYRMGALWDIRADTTLYAQYATAVEPRFALFTLGRTDTPFSLTNARQVEGGIKHAFANGRGELLAAVYHIEKTDIPSTDPLTGFTVQVGKQTSRGFEISGSYRPMETLRLEANFAYVNARYDEYRTSTTANYTGNTPPNVPQVVANFGATWQPFTNWAVGGWINHKASIKADDANLVTLPSATTADVFATYRFAQNADLTFRIRNITDAVYAAWATDANYVILGSPRTFELSLRTRW